MALHKNRYDRKYRKRNKNYCGQHYDGTFECNDPGIGKDGGFTCRYYEEITWNNGEIVGCVYEVGGNGHRNNGCRNKEAKEDFLRNVRGLKGALHL